MVADHVLVEPAAGVSEDAFKRDLETHGFTLGRRLLGSQAYVVQLPDRHLQALPEALKTLSALPSVVAYAEPDYVVYPTEEVSDPDFGGGAYLDENGVTWYPEAALNSLVAYPHSRDPARFAAKVLAAQEEVRLDNLPEGGRVIAFDSPQFLPGPGNYNPRMEEQNMIFEEGGGVYIQDAYTDGYPNNGTYYARCISYGGSIQISHREHVTFALSSVDLSEYSTVLSSVKSVAIKGYKPNGAVVTQNLELDGIIDGTGPLEDFQTFTFGNEFSGLDHVSISSSPYMLDNVVVVVEGQEVGPPPPPELPVLYDVTWDAPIHQVGELTAVGGPYAPSSINFGTPTVVAAKGDLADRPLQFSGSGYQQIRFRVYLPGTQYRVEYDFLAESAPGNFVVFCDGSGVQKLDITGQTIGLSQSGISGEPANIGTLTLGQVHHFRLDIDLALQSWTIGMDGTPLYTGPYDTSQGGLRDIRFHMNGGGPCAIDNFVISVFDAVEPPAGPNLGVTPARVDFGASPVQVPVTRSLRLRNVGVETLTISNAVVSDPAFALDLALPLDLIPGAYRDASLVFTPPASGVSTGVVSFSSNDPDTPLYDVPVSGTGHGWPDIELEPPGLDVTMVHGSLGTEVFTIRNTGDYALVWSLINAPATNELPGTKPDPVVPDDPLLAQLWGLADPDTAGAGIDAAHAWAIATGDSQTVVAVIDTGVDYAHPDLVANIWTNPGETPGDLVDNDHNGLVDDVHGWDFCNEDNDPADGHGHGTHVAGTLAATGDNGAGVVGVAWSAKIMAIKFLSDQGFGYNSDAVEAVGYAALMGARLSNNSWGGGGPSASLYNAIQSSILSNCLFAAAAGNNGVNNDRVAHYPSSYGLDGILSVAATDPNDELAYYSNYGFASVDLAAPGSGILSLLPGNQYGIKSGTSMATPHASGAAVLVLSRNPSFGVTEVKNTLMQNVDRLPSLDGKMASEGRLNAYRALARTPPAWLQPLLNAGVVAPEQTQEVPLSVDTTHLDPGHYVKRLLITSNDPDEPQVELAVNLWVTSVSEMSLWQLEAFGEANLLFNSLESSLWAMTADPDEDGLLNAHEFFYGTHPLEKSREPVSLEENGGGPVYRYQKRAGATGLTETVEWCGDLVAGEWQNTGLETVPGPDGAEPGLTQWNTRFSGAPPVQAAFRLRLSPAP
jgi:subtilisin family serine protease